MFGKQIGDKLRWATASELKEKNVSTAFGQTCSLVLLTNIWRWDETEPLTQRKVQFMRLKHLHLIGIHSKQAGYNNKSEVTRKRERERDEHRKLLCRSIHMASCQGSSLG